MMKLYRLGVLPRQQSMLVFHALARMAVEALVIVSPGDRLVSVGYFQETEKVVDLEYCQQRGISVMRREIGGGTTLLDGGQVFFQVVGRRDNPVFPGTIEGIYRWFSAPVVATYEGLGVRASFRPVNDIVTPEGRKVCGLGGADIGDCLVFVGNIIMDFDYETMVRVIKVPDEKFRDKVFKTLGESLSTIKRETGRVPERRRVEDLLVRNFARILGPLEEAALTPDIEAVVAEVEKELMSDEFLFKKGRSVKDYVKVAQGVEVIQRNHKAPGGLITATLVMRQGVIESVTLAGDFTFRPREGVAKLEESLCGTPAARGEVLERVEAFYSRHGPDSPGVTPGDFATAMCGG